ncbi:MAG: hypothetical protein GY832_01390 [Chloroflexi bacterium]|nr:hypothetical protein [Chloroflexota bacterium]
MVTIATTSPTDPALSGLPVANIRNAGDVFSGEEFQTIPNVPVFAEHETTAKDGRKLRFTATELQAVTERCNRRINETGDYAALVLGHTPDPNDPGGTMPDLVGYAGPFRLGRLGDDGTRGRYAILADFHVYKNDLDRVKKHPRRSPELWLEDRFEEMFLDPIALLAAEAPRLDMGLLYSARHDGRQVEKYTAVAPAAGNCFIASDSLDDPRTRDRRDYAATSPQQKGTFSMISPEDIQQIVAAFDQLDWVQKIKAEQTQGPNSSMAPGLEGPPIDPMAPMGAEPGIPPMDAPPAAPPIAPPAPDMGAGPGEVPPAPSMEPPMSDGPPPGLEPQGPPDDTATPAAPSESGPPAAPPADKEKEKLSQYAADGGGGDDGKANATGEYQTAATVPDMGGATIDHQAGTDKKNYAALDEMEDDEFEKYAISRKSRRRKKYAAEGSAESANAHTPGEASVEPADPGPKGEGSVGNDDGEAASSYQTASPPEKFSKDKAESIRLQSQVDQLSRQLRDEEGRRVDAERYSALQDRRQHYAFDLEAEVERCRYSRMTGDQFRDHCQCIEDNYGRIPVGASLPTHVAGSAQAAAGSQSELAREKYSKELSCKAFEVCQEAAISGKPLDYETVLEKLHNGEEVKA